MKFKTVPRLVVTDADWEMLRIMRNSCRAGLTGNQQEINREQQHIYATRAAINPHLRHYIHSADGIDVGWVRLEWKDGFVIPTMGVASWARGKRYSWSIVKQLLLAAGGPLKGVLNVDNYAIVHVDLKLGFVKDGEIENKLMPIKCDWPPPVEDWP